MAMTEERISWPGWETVGIIGRGQFGEVYEIRRTLGGVEEKSALKVIRIPQDQRDVETLYSKGYDDEEVTMTFQSHLDSIIAEYSMMRKMNGHTNVVCCDDIRYVQHDDGIGWDIFIKMELLTPLTRALPDRVDEKTVVKLAKDICAALILCNKSNIIHRDVKPQNIFVSEFGDYKLGDFGIAKTAEKTGYATKAGTGPFMAPEVVHVQPYGHGADIYSLGIVLYWLLNERRMPLMPLPPTKQTATQEEKANERRRQGEPLPAPAHGSAKLKKIVLKACAFDPAQRYHTAAEMLEDLENAFGGGKVVVPPTSQPPQPPQPPKDTNKERKGKEKKESRKAWLWILLSVLAAVLIVVLLLCLRNCGSAPADGPSTSQPSQTPSATQPAEPTGTSSAPEDPNPVQVDWTEWADTLPDFVNAEDYEIKEKTLYSIQEKEFTSSTNTNSMDGWELYDTLEAGAGFGNWSGWTDDYVEETSTRQVEAKTFYRYQDKEFTTSSNSSLNGWELYDTTYVLSEPGPWSNWSTTVYEPSETRTIRSDTQYRSSEREWATSTDPYVSGWVMDSSYTDYTDYGSWSGWSTTPVESSNTREVEVKTQYSYRYINYELVDLGWSDWSSWSFERQNISDYTYVMEDSRTVWGYYYFQCPNCGAHMYGWNITCFTWANGCGSATIPQNSWHQYYSPVSWNDAGLWEFHGTGKYATTLNGERYFKWTEGGTKTQYRYATWLQEYQRVEGDWSSWSDTPIYSEDGLEVKTRTVYRYRDREPYEYYLYYRWSSPSSWEFGYIEPNDDLKVESRRVYSYQDCEKIYTYHYYRWTGLSNWSETPVSASDTRNVEEKVRYRYKDQVTETTYYFYRWSDWSEWTDAYAEASDTTEVKTKVVYSYRSK